MLKKLLLLWGTEINTKQLRGPLVRRLRVLPVGVATWQGELNDVVQEVPDLFFLW